MKFNHIHKMVHTSVNTTNNYPIFKVTITGIIAAYFYGCVALSAGFRIIFGDPSQPNTVLMLEIIGGW